MTRVEEVMTRDVATCHPDAPLSDACQIMWRVGCGVLPVTEAATERVLGILTDRDIAVAACRSGRSPADVPAAEAMNQKVYACDARDELGVAHARMREHRVRRLPVTAGHGELVGLLSLDDLARHAVARDDDRERRAVAETLAAISSD